MFRLRCASTCLRRLFHGGTVTRDKVLTQLQVCSGEEQLLDVVGKNKAKLTVNHVHFAVGMLWQLQKEKLQMYRTVGRIKAHPQFLTLRVLAENKIALMDDNMLVDLYYSFLRLNVDPHDSLIQQIVSEAWLRMERFPMSTLSKFAVCLSDQNLQHSPLMGRVTDIMDKKLSSIADARVLTTLMISTSSLISPRLRDALISKANELLDTMDPSNYNNPRRMVQFLRNVKCNDRPLLEKCNQLLLINIPRMDADNICIIMGLYQLLQFNSCELRLAAKQRLMELIDSSIDPSSFTKLFVTLTPMADPETVQRLENTALLMADELNPNQIMCVAEALEEIQSRNLNLRNKVASVIQRKLHVYRPVELARVTQALFMLQYQNPEFLANLRHMLVKLQQRSVIPYEVAMLTRVLSLLQSPQHNKDMKPRVEAVVTQCNLGDLNTISYAIGRWIQTDPSHRQGPSSGYTHLLQSLNRCGHQRLQTADRLDLVLEDLKHISGEWFEETLLREVVLTFQRMMDQINWSNVPDLAVFLTRTNYLCPPLMDKIARVTIEDIDKIHHSATYSIQVLFSELGYDSAQTGELYDVCIRRFTPHISSFDPHLLALLAYSLAVAERFPEQLLREIFSIDFLRKLDYQLEALPDSLNMKTRRRLMQLNRAVCLECPELQVPWFHEGYCQQLQRKGSAPLIPVLQPIHKMLSELLGGVNYVRAAVVTPYFYTTDFECILDKHLQPMPYYDLSSLQIYDRGLTGDWQSSQDNICDKLPPGAQRVAVQYLGLNCFCKNMHQMNGATLMRKRHFEILGYRVVQIPHFEWNSMELSAPDAWKDYLKKKIFGELSS